MRRDGGRERLFAVLLIVAGIALRLWQYLANRSLRVDEAALAESILSRSGTGLTQALDYGQIAPVGFLWLEKASTVLFGSSEYALRLPLLLAGVAALFVFRALSRRVLEPGPALLALALFALNRWLVFASSDVKPYASDVLIAAALLLGAVRCVEDPPGRRGMRALLLGGFAAGFFSFPALLVSGSIFGAALLAFLVRRDRSTRALAGIGFVWTLGAAASAGWTLRTADPEARAFMDAYWRRHGGMPNFAEGIGEVGRWLVRAGRVVFAFLADATYLPGPLEFFLALFLAVATAAGALRLRRTNPLPAALVTLPILVAIASAVAQRYPFVGRLALFLFPSFLVLIAAAFAWGFSDGRPLLRRLTALGAVGLAGIFALRTFTVVPERFEELRPVLRRLAEHPAGGDASYWLYSSAQKAFRYYELRLGLPEGPVQFVCRAPSYWPLYVSEVRKLEPGKRVWVVLSHLNAAEADFIRRTFDVFGAREAAYEDVGAAVYLYVVGTPDPAAVEALERSIPPARRTRERGCPDEARQRGSMPVVDAEDP